MDTSTLIAVVAVGAGAVAVLLMTRKKKKHTNTPPPAAPKSGWPSASYCAASAQHHAPGNIATYKWSGCCNDGSYPEVKSGVQNDYVIKCKNGSEPNWGPDCCNAGPAK